MGINGGDPEKNSDLDLGVNICKDELVRKDLDEGIDNIQEINNANEELNKDEEIYNAEKEIDELDKKDSNVNTEIDLDDHIRKYENLRNLCCKLLFISNVCERDNNPRRIESCTDAVIIAAEKAEKYDFSTVIDLVIEKEPGKKAFNINFFRDPLPATLWEQDACIHQDIQIFAKYLFTQTPRHFSKPQAAPGVAEFMFCVLHPDITKPKIKGDLSVVIDGAEKLIEVKGKKGAIRTDVSGDAFKVITENLAKNSGIDEIIKNIDEIKDVKGVRLELNKYFEGYKKLFEELGKKEGGLDKGRAFIKDWLSATGGDYTDLSLDDFVNQILVPDDQEKNLIKFDRELLEKTITLGFFNYLINIEKINSLIMVQEGENVIKIVANLEIFEKKLGKEIKIHQLQMYPKIGKLGAVLDSIK